MRASERASEPIPVNRQRSPGSRGALGRKDGYDRKSLPRRNWLYKIGSAPGSYTCLLRMQTSSPNARKPHESAARVDAPTRTVSTDTRPCSRFPPRYLPSCLSSPMHEYVARRSRKAGHARNWKIPVFPRRFRAIETHLDEHSEISPTDFNFLQDEKSQLLFLNIG